MVWLNDSQCSYYILGHVSNVSGNQEFFIEEKDNKARNAIKREKAIHVCPTGGNFNIHTDHQFKIEYVLAPTDAFSNTYLPAEVTYRTYNVADADDASGEKVDPSRVEVKFSESTE